MRSGWVKIDGRLTKQVRQEADEVQAILDANHHFRTSSDKVGGVGSENMRSVARVPAAMHARWVHEWRLKGGLQGTGLKAAEYALLRASKPDYSQFVTAPSGKTGFEAAARKLAFGYEASKIPVLRKKGPQTKHQHFQVVKNSDFPK